MSLKSGRVIVRGANEDSHLIAGAPKYRIHIIHSVRGA